MSRVPSVPLGHDRDPPAPSPETPARDPILYGRDPECAALDALLAGARQGRSAALVLRAEPGLGKSSLLAYARARGSDMCTLDVRGVEPEADLPFAALHELLQPVLASIDRIPDVQAAALRTALGIAAGQADNRFVIALAVLNLLSEAATGGPVLCLIDDAQWLDRPSADTLAFVARRLDAEGIVVLAAERADHERSFAGAGLPERGLAGLDAPSADRLLEDRFGSELAPEVRRAIRDSAQGNPLALLEIPEALTPDQRSGREPLPRPMPIGRDLEALFLARVARLPGPARTLLLVAAADGTGEAGAVLAASARLGVAPSALLEAEGSGLIRSEGSLLAFRHPLIRRAIYQGASLAQRQVVHRALLDVLVGEANADRRAWHAATLVHGTDDVVADELARTAERARGRSGYATASQAYQRAAELSSEPDVRSRRLVAAARESWGAGRPEEAAVLLGAAQADATDGSFAELRHVQGEIEFYCGRPVVGATLLLEGAGTAATADPAKALRMLLDAGLCAAYTGNLGLITEAGRQAERLPIAAPDPDAPLVDLLVGIGRVMEGRLGDFRTRLVQALDRIGATSEPRILIWAGAAATAAGGAARSDEFARRAEALARSTMAVGSVALVLERIAWTNMMRGEVGAAELRSVEGERLALEAGLMNSACFHRSILAWVAGMRGDEEACLARAEQVSSIGREHGLAAHLTIAGWAVGLGKLGRGRWDDATTTLEAVTSPASGFGPPYVLMRVLPDLVEAAVMAHRLDVAEAATGRLATMVGQDAPEWQAALAARCRALIAPSVEQKEGHLIEALAFHEADPRPFSLARTRLLLGQLLRRERRRIEARPHLRGSLEMFERLGTSPWADRARAELRATGETARRREPSTLTQLTPQQTQIARLVAEGATNKEVAARLFLSPRTVDYHLRNVFLKLGISARSELIRLHAEELDNGRL